jgi:hypothetical protein
MGFDILTEALMEATRRQRKLIHEGEYAAEIEVELITTDDAWSPYLSRESVAELDELRRALRRGDLRAAARIAKVYRLMPINAA